MFETAGKDVVAGLGLEEKFRAFGRDLNAEGFWRIASISFFPLPLQAATLGSGAFNYPFAPYLAVIVLARGVRFYGLAAITLVLGERKIARPDMKSGLAPIFFEAIYALTFSSDKITSRRRRKLRRPE